VKFGFTWMPPAQEAHGAVGAGPEGHKDDLRPGTPLL